MFGFQSKRSKEEEKAGIQFLASMLVCYPEISSLSYDPRRSTLTFEFIVRGDYPAAKLDAFARLLSESIETYHVVVADEVSKLGKELYKRLSVMGGHAAAVGLALDAALLDQAADAEQLALRRLAGRHFGRRDVERDIAVEGVEDEGGDDADDGQGAADKGKFLVTGFHSEVVLLSARS